MTPEEEAVTEPTTPPTGGETPPPGETPPIEPPKAVTADDLARVQAALDKERDLRKAAEKSVKDFETQRQASMTEAERAVSEAEERGRTAVRAEYGQRLAQTEFRAAAAARNAGYDVAKALKYVNLGALIGEDGEPDSKAIAAAVADLVPEASTGIPTPPSFDGGTRQPAPAGKSMNDLIRGAAGRA